VAQVVNDTSAREPKHEGSGQIILSPAPPTSPTLGWNNVSLLIVKFARHPSILHRNSSKWAEWLYRSKLSLPWFYLKITRIARAVNALASRSRRKIKWSWINGAFFSILRITQQAVLKEQTTYLDGQHRTDMPGCVEKQQGLFDDLSSLLESKRICR